MIVGGIVLLLPGVCVGMFDLKWGLFVVLGAAAMIAYGLLRITTRTLATARVQARSPQANAIEAILIVAAWGILLALFLVALHWVEVFSQLGHIRWQ
jgi:hypothetical protein